MSGVTTGCLDVYAERASGAALARLLTLPLPSLTISYTNDHDWMW
jgi:hypothetical protein